MVSCFQSKILPFYQCMTHADSLFLSLFISLSHILYLSPSHSLTLSLSLSLSLALDLLDKIISNHKPWEIQDFIYINRCDILISYFYNVWVFFRANSTRNRVQKNYSVFLCRIHWLQTSWEGLPPVIDAHKSLSLSLSLSLSQLFLRKILHSLRREFNQLSCKLH